MNVKLGRESQALLATVKPELYAVIKKSFEYMPFDVKILEGVRSIERQRFLFNKKPPATKTMNSKHLTGDAIDMAPYPIDWNDKERFKQMADAVMQASKDLNIRVRWGGDWNMNGNWKDEKFYDGPHFELI